MTLEESRRAIRHLLDPHRPADARAAYYACDHPDNRTTLVCAPPDAPRAAGYLCLSRTGLDLLRPLLTMRLPAGDPETAAALFGRALAPGFAALIGAPLRDAPLIEAFFSLESRQELHLLALERNRFAPLINVLTTTETTADGRARVAIRRAGETLATAVVNWQSARFAEIGVETRPDARRQGWGRSVTAVLCQQLLAQGRTPLYAVAADNQASLALAAELGFVDTGARELFCAAVYTPA